MSTDLILIRHGETDWNRELRFQGHIDVPLNDMVHEQARRLGLRMAREKAQHLVSSDLMRCQQTAAPTSLRRFRLSRQATRIALIVLITPKAMTRLMTSIARWEEVFWLASTSACTRPISRARAASSCSRSGLATSSLSFAASPIS